MRDKKFLMWFSSSKGRGSGFSLMSFGNFIAAVFTYLRQVEIARVFGTSWKTDAFAVSLVFPVLVREVISHSIGATFIPIYSKVKEQKGNQAAEALLNRILTWTGLAGLILTGLLFFLSRHLVFAVGPGLDQEALSLASVMLKMMLPILVLSAFSGVLQGLCNFEKRYGLTSILRVVEITTSLVIVFLLSRSIGIMALPLSVLTGSVGMFIVLLTITWRLHYKFRIELNPVDPDFARQIRMALPIIGGTVFGFLGPVADKILASFLRESSVTALEYANRIVKILFSILLLPISTLANVSLSSLSARKDAGSFREELKTLLNWNSSLMIPGSAILMVLSVPLVSLLFQRGEFSISDSRMVSYSLIFYAPWLSSFSFGSVISRAFFALKDTTTPVLIGIWGMIVNVLLNFILIAPLGIGGLALGTTISSSAKVVLLLYFLRKKTGYIQGRDLAAEHLKIFLGVAAMAGTMLLMKQIAPYDMQAGFAEKFGKVILYLASGTTVYIALLISLGSDVSRTVLRKIKSLGKRPVR